MEQTVYVAESSSRDAEGCAAAGDATFATTTEQSVVLESLATLPPFPPAALQLLSIATDAASAIADVEWVFRADPVLATDLLAVANSAAFGLRVPVESIRHAVMLLGLERVKSLGFTLAMQFYMRNHHPPMPVLRVVWSHSIATGMIAERIGALADEPLRGLYTLGLLHDIGRLGLLLSDAHKYANAFQQEFRTVADAMAAEQHQFGITHTDAGAHLARVWKFPESLAPGIRCHHNTIAADGDPRLRIVQLACQMADALGYGEFKRPADSEFQSRWPDSLCEHAALHPDLLRTKLRMVLGSIFAVRIG
jgi:HD-like signal output (HDOD) protein